MLYFTGVFDVDQSRRILQAGKDIGLAINFHAEELNPIKGTEVSRVDIIWEERWFVNLGDL